MTSKDWKASFEIEGKELLDLVKNAVEEKTLKQQKVLQKQKKLGLLHVL